jgi:hypothetical protein
VNAELAAFVHFGDPPDIFQVEDMLAPAHFLAADIEAGHGGKDGHEQHERALPDKRIEQELHGNRQTDHHHDELGELQDAPSRVTQRLYQSGLSR